MGGRRSPRASAKADTTSMDGTQFDPSKVDWNPREQKALNRSTPTAAALAACLEPATVSGASVNHQARWVAVRRQARAEEIGMERKFAVLAAAGLGVLVLG